MSDGFSAIGSLAKDTAAQSGMAFGWLVVCTGSAVVIGMTTRGRFALMLPTVRKWMGESTRDTPMDIFNPAVDPRHLLRTGDLVVAKPHSHHVDLDPTNNWMAGRVVFTVAGIARVWFENETHGECDLEAVDIRYAPTRDDDWGVAAGKAGEPSDAKEVYIGLESNDALLAQTDDVMVEECGSIDNTHADATDADANTDSTGESKKTNSITNNSTTKKGTSCGTSLLKSCCGSLTSSAAWLYTTQLVLYLSMLGIFITLILIASHVSYVSDGATGASMFFAGSTLYCGAILLFCTCYNKWQPIYSMHDILGATIMVSLTLFILCQLIANSSISSFMSYRSAGVMWMTISLVPLYFFAGDRIKARMAIGDKKEDAGNGAALLDAIRIPPTARRGMAELAGIFSQDFSAPSMALESSEDAGDADVDTVGGTADGTAAVKTSYAKKDVTNVRGSLSMSATLNKYSTRKAPALKSLSIHDVDPEDLEQGSAGAIDATSNAEESTEVTTVTTQKNEKKPSTSSLNFEYMDEVLWALSLVPYIVFVVLSWTSTTDTNDTIADINSTASARAPLVLLCVSLINEVTIANLLNSETYTIFGLVVVSRYCLVLVGAHFWLMGVVGVLLITSAFHTSQIVTLYLPPPGGIVSTIYDVMDDIHNKDEENNELLKAAKEKLLASILETKSRDAELAASGDTKKDNGEKDNAKDMVEDIVEEIADTNGSTNEETDGKPENEESTIPLSDAIAPTQTAIVGKSEKDKKQDDKKDKFRTQALSLLMSQLTIAILIITGFALKSSDDLFLYPIRYKNQPAWAGLMWMSALCLFFCYLVRHCVLTGGFGSISDLASMFSGSISKPTQPANPATPASPESSNTADVTHGDNEKAQDEEENNSESEKDETEMSAANEVSTEVTAGPPQAENGEQLGEKAQAKKSCMYYFFAYFSDLVRPGMDEDERANVGFLVFMAYSSLLGCAFLGGWLADTYIVVPLATCLPVCIFSFVNWLAWWEGEGCPGFDSAHFSEMCSKTVLIYYNCVDATSKVKGTYKFPDSASSSASNGNSGGDVDSENPIQDHIPRDDESVQGVDVSNVNGTSTTTTTSGSTKPLKEYSCVSYYLDMTGAVLLSIVFSCGDFFKWATKGNSLQFSVFNLLLGLLVCLIFPMAYVALSIGLWLIAVGLTGMAVTRWRTVCTFDTPCLLFTGLSWLPTLSWSIGVGLSAETFGYAQPSGSLQVLMTVVLVIILATALQLVFFTYCVYSDLLLMYPIQHGRVNTTSSSMIKIEREEDGDDEEKEDIEGSIESDAAGEEPDEENVTEDVKPKNEGVADESTDDADKNSTTNKDDENTPSDIESGGGGEVDKSADGGSKKVSKKASKAKKVESKKPGSCTIPCGDSFGITIFSPWALGFDRPGFPVSTIIILGTVVFTAVLGTSIFLMCFPSYVFYGVALLVALLYFFGLTYFKVGLLVIRSEISVSDLGWFSIVFSVVAILTGCIIFTIIYPGYVFWHLSAGWFILAFLAFVRGVREGIMSPYLKTPTSPFYYPVYALKGEQVLDDSANSSYIFLSFVMMSVWALWAAEMISPEELGSLLFVLCIVACAIYLKLSSEGAFLRSLQSEVTPEIVHIAMDRSIKSLYSQTDHNCIVDDHKNTINYTGNKTTESSADDKVESDSEVDQKVERGSTENEQDKAGAKVDKAKGAVAAKNADAAAKNAEQELALYDRDHVAHVQRVGARRRATVGTINHKTAPPHAASGGGGESLPGNKGTDATTQSSRFVPADQKRANLDFIEALVYNRDIAASYLNETVSKRCVGALSSWPIMNIVWGRRDGCFTDQDAWDRLYKESLIVLHAHDDVLTQTSGLSKLVAMIKLRALAMVADDKRTREAELVSFLKDSQPSMHDMTVADLASLPPLLLASLFTAFVTYQKGTHALAAIHEESAKQEEKLLTAETRARERQAEIVRLQKAAEIAARAAVEQERKDKEALETLKKNQEMRRQREAEDAQSKQLAAEDLEKVREEAKKREAAELEKMQKRQQQAAADRIAGKGSGGNGDDGVVTTFGVELGVDFASELERINKGVESGELCGNTNFKGHRSWTHEFPNRYVDPDFGAMDVSAMLGEKFQAATSDGSGKEGNRLITLRRGDTILPGLTDKLEEGGVIVKSKDPTPDNLHQGGIGDCWLIAGIATVCEQNDGQLIRDVFIHADHAKGIYALRLYVNGQSRVVFIDDYLPTYCNDSKHLTVEKNQNNKQVAFCGLNKPAYFWCCLIEKAYAKVTGSYALIVGGFEDVAMADLTGGIPRKIGDINEAMDKNWAMLMERRRNGDLLGAGSLSGSDTDKTDKGVVKGHAYSILDVRELEGHRLLQMRNPWGSGEWKGRWSDNSGEWTPRYKKILGWEDADDGKFWISFEDFVRNYRTVYVCQMVANQEHSVQSGSWSKTDNTAGGFRMQDVPVYNVKCDAACKLTVVLQQAMSKEDYGEMDCGDNEVHIGVQIYEGKSVRQKGGVRWERYNIIDESSYTKGRTLTETDMKPDNWMRVVCATYEAGVEANFSVSMFADCEKLTVERVPNE
jgi:hypothetical protein